MILCKVSRCWADREFIFNSDPKLEETFPCPRGLQTLVNRVGKQTQPAEQDRAATSAGGHRARVRPSGPCTAPRSRAADSKDDNSTLQHSSRFSEQTVSRGLSVLIKKGSGLLHRGPRREGGCRMETPLCCLLRLAGRCENQPPGHPLSAACRLPAWWQVCKEITPVTLLSTYKVRDAAG